MRPPSPSQLYYSVRVLASQFDYFQRLLFCELWCATFLSKFSINEYTATRVSALIAAQKVNFPFWRSEIKRISPTSAKRSVPPPSTTATSRPALCGIFICRQHLKDTLLPIWWLFSSNAAVFRVYFDTLFHTQYVEFPTFGVRRYISRPLLFFHISVN